jgi:hypothetical protein
MTSPDDLRIGDWERNEVMSALREHFAQGRITSEELDQRLEAALTARTAGDLKRVTTDLPDPRGTQVPLFDPRRQGPVQHVPFAHGPRFGPDHPAMRRHPYRGGRVRGGRPPILFLVFAVLIAASLVSGTAWPLIFMFKMLFFVWIAFAVIGLIHHRRHRDHHGMRR